MPDPTNPAPGSTPTSAPGPAWRAVADDLRNQIAAGKLQVGAAIPSTPKLQETYGVSSTVVRHAVTQLSNEKLVMGYPGKGVYVIATPGQADQASTGGVASQEDVDALRSEVAEMRASLRQLYDRLGHKYPQSASSAETTTGTDRRTGTGG